MTGIYIHVPFCLRKCPYCDFYSVAWSEELSQLYTAAVIRNLDEYAQYNLSVDTVYFGGGTPSLLSSNQMSDILGSVSENFNLHDPEITMECNPTSVNLQKLREYRHCGVNRLSFGIQSADDSQLKWLGRLHDFEKASNAVNDSIKAGFDNISCDIMLGLAGQSMQSLENTINIITNLPIVHISAYLLKIESSTPFDNVKIKSEVADEDMQCEMYLHTVSLLESKGFVQYEISNFAKDNKVSRHNMKYWQGDEYIGIGPSAHSYFDGTRFACAKNVEDFVMSKSPKYIITDPAPNLLEEYIMLGLRLKKGIDLSKISELGNGCISDKIAKKAQFFSENNLCKFDGDNIYLTPHGFLVTNEIITQFIDCDR